VLTSSFLSQSIGYVAQQSAQRLYEKKKQKKKKKKKTKKLRLTSLCVVPRNDLCPAYAPFFGAMGAASALIFTVFGAAYGTAKSGVGISTMGVVKPELVMRAIIPVIFAGVVAIYGLIIAVIITTNLLPGGPASFQDGQKTVARTGGYSLFKGMVDLGGGLACGLAGLGAGMCIGIVGDAGVRASAQQPRLYVGMVLILIFSEALGLYGLIVGIILSQVRCQSFRVFHL
jgi:V-type H+-transporting ATPase proteolipid subunit